tara:strand:- start:43550 stop:43795 length:246 start_codon:yes stop_codon:yes gene_type:complete
MTHPNTAPLPPTADFTAGELRELNALLDKFEQDDRLEELPPLESDLLEKFCVLIYETLEPDAREAFVDDLMTAAIKNRGAV